jgi:hypothetical protein
MGSDEPDDALWTLGQAESITSVRGTPVRVRNCRGLSAPSRDGATPRYERFACVAGARLPSETFDTVAVLYELRPLGPSTYRLENVRFHGGPGIP